MDLTAREINEKQFHDAWRGYNQEEVDDFLDRVAELLDRLQRENRALHERVRDLDQAVSTSRDTEEMLKKTLLTAQRAAEEAIGNAKLKAEQLIGEAEERARRAGEEAKVRIAAVEDEVRRKTLEADQQHAHRKRELDASIDLLRAFETDLKQRLKAFLEQQLKALDTLTSHETSRPNPAGRATTPSGTRQETRSLRTQPSEGVRAQPSPSPSGGAPQPTVSTRQPDAPSGREPVAAGAPERPRGKVAGGSEQSEGAPPRGVARRTLRSFLRGDEG